jgi:hypothetical protein
MSDMLLWVGRWAGAIGILLCVVGAGARLAGEYWLGGFQVGTLLLAGTSAMIAGCFCLLVLLTRRSR